MAVLPLENIIQRIEEIHKRIEQIAIRELLEEDISPVDLDFFKNIWEEIVRIRAEIDKIPDKKMRQNMVQSIIFLKEDIKNLVYVRLSKIIRSLIYTDFQSIEGKLSDIERKVILSIFRVMEDYFPEKRKSEESIIRNFAIIFFLKKYPVILASNGKSYGPFEAGDIACLPLPDARFLIRKGVAKGLDEV